MNCRINYLYEKFPNNQDFAAHLEKIELEIWNTLKNENFPRFQYEGINYFTLSPKNTKENKHQLKALQNLRDKWGSQELFLMKKLYPFDYSMVQLRMGAIVNKQFEIFNKTVKPVKEIVPVIYDENKFDKYQKIKQLENNQENKYQKLTEEEKNQTIAEAAKKAGSIKTLHDLAARMADRIGGKVYFENKRDVDYKGYTRGTDFVINEAYADTSTVVHEILGHPIINAIRNVSDETEQFFSGKVENVQTLYKNLLKELEYGTGKEVLNRIKRDYSSGFKGIFGGVEISYFEENNKWYKTFDGKNKTETTKEEAEIRAKVNGEKLFTLEEQQEEAIVELLGIYTANKLDAVKDKGLIAILKKLLKEMTAYLRSLFNSKEIEIEKLDVSMTLDDLANLLAYTNSKLLLPNSTIEYTTPDNKKFKTYAEASKHISNLAKSVEDVDLDSINFKKAKTIEDVPVSFNSFIISDSKEQLILDDDGIPDIITDYLFEPLMVKKVKNNWYVSEGYDFGYVLYLYDTDPNVKETLKHGILIPEEKVIELFNTRFENPEFGRFIGKNKEYEQSKEIIEEWKKVNNIVYNPEEVYSRGQEFVSVVGAYSDFDVKLMMQNLLSHIEDNEKAGGKFAISVFTKPVDKTIGHLEGGGGKIKFKIFPKSEDILWAANRDVYSGSVWDAGEKVNKDKKSELLGVSYTKYPSLGNVKSVQPNLADIIDDIQWGHNELGISLKGNNFRLEYDKDIPYTTKKIIDSVNSILDQKYGKLVKPEINKNQIGIQPKITNETLKESIDSVQKRTVKLIDRGFGEMTGLYQPEIIDISDGGKNERYLNSPFKLTYEDSEGKLQIELFKTLKEAENRKKEILKTIYKNEKDYNSQALINTKIAALKEVAKKYPRSLIRSEVVSISEFNEVQYQKLPSQLDKNQSNQIEELKQSDPRWNKYSNEDIQRFIDSVFPESKVKEIVYHGTDSIFEKFDKYKFREGQQGNGLMFSGTITSIEKEKGNQVEGFYFLKEKTSNYGKIILPVLLNIKNPKDFGKNIETMFFGDINPTYEKLSFVTPEELKEYKKNNIDSLIGEVTGVGNEIVVFEPEQIYILNSDKAISDMEKFVGGKPTFNKELVQNIQKLFESNPELANDVYEAVGLKTLENSRLEKDIKELIKDREDIPSSIFLSYLVDNNLIPKIQEYITSIGYRGGEWNELYGRLTLNYSISNTKSEIAKLMSHELMHALSHKYITSYEALRQPDFKEYIDKVNENEKIKGTNRKIELINLTREQVDAFDNLVRIKEKVFDFIKAGKFNKNEKLKNANFGSLNYAFSELDKKEDIHEFISEAFSNPILIDVLKQIPTEGNKSNLFKEFIKALKIILGFNNESIIEDILYYSEKAFINEALKESNTKKQQAQQLYSQYLDTVFPDSKVKDIVYHGSKNKLQENKFDLSKARFEKAIFFFKNRINALKWESENPIKIQKKDLKNIINLNKDLNLEDDSIENNIFYTLAGAQNISDLLNLPNSELILEDFNKIGGAELYLEKSLEEIKKILDKHTSGKTNNVINAILNIRNPKKESNLDYIKLSKEGEKIKDIFREASKNNDGVILENITEYTSSKELAEKNFKTKTVTFNANFGIQTDELYSLNTDTQYAVFEPEQIHILGSKQDVEGFQNFVKQNQFQQKQQAQKLYSEYLQQNPNGNVKQFESWVLNSLNKKDNNFEDNVSCFI